MSRNFSEDGKIETRPTDFRDFTTTDVFWDVWLSEFKGGNDSVNVCDVTSDVSAECEKDE